MLPLCRLLKRDVHVPSIPGSLHLLKPGNRGALGVGALNWHRWIQSGKQGPQHAGGGEQDKNSASSPPNDAEPLGTSPTSAVKIAPHAAPGPPSEAKPTLPAIQPYSQPQQVAPRISFFGPRKAALHQAPTPLKPTAKLVQVIKGVNIIINIHGKPGAKDKDELRMKTTAETGSKAHLPPGQEGEKEEAKKTILQGWHKTFMGVVESTFLPAGYPKTVGDRYLEFVMWQNLSNFAVTANSVLASTFLLYAVGVGDGAVATASALNWVIKDGLGQMGTLVFGKLVAHNFDIHSKTWYFLSQVKLSLAILLEMLTILLPQHFLIMGSIANSFKGLAWMASGSTRSVFNLSYARDNNIADITAKSTSQFIFASLFGTAAGATICTYIEQDFEVAALVYVVLAGTTFVSAYKTVTVIPLVTLNNARLQLLSEKFLECMHVMKQDATAVAEAGRVKPRHLDRCYKDDGMELDHSQAEGLMGKIPGPVALSEEDPPVPAWLTGDQRFLNPSIVVGSSIEWVVGNEPDLILLLVTSFKYTHYIIIPTPTVIHVILHKAADSKDICQAYLQANILRRRARDGAEIGEHDLANLRIALQDTLLTAERLTQPFMTALSQRGWRTEKIVVEAERRRAVW